MQSKIKWSQVCDASLSQPHVSESIRENQCRFNLFSAFSFKHRVSLYEIFIFWSNLDFIVGKYIFLRRDSVDFASIIVPIKLILVDGNDNGRRSPQDLAPKKKEKIPTIKSIFDQSKKITHNLTRCVRGNSKNKSYIYRFISVVYLLAIECFS